ncbi:MAG: RDD family protein [Actinomycetota bacterium]|nr:RDD family protein [Actinomycetota bacterium]
MSQPGAWAVTPEAVILELPTATLGTRVPARVLDVLVEGFTAAVVLGGLTIAGINTTAVVIAAALLGFVALFVYPTVLEAWAGGRTLGKLAAGIRVLSADGAPISFRQAAIRAILAPVDLLCGAVVMLCSGRDQRLGDIVAGTVVVRERMAAQQLAAAVFPTPPGCEYVVASLDVSGVTEADYELVRAYLLRWSQLTPPARWGLAVDLARVLAVRLGHLLPPWIAPDQYLACLVAACQQRR